LQMPVITAASEKSVKQCENFSQCCRCWQH